MGEAFNREVDIVKDIKNKDNLQDNDAKNAAESRKNDDFAKFDRAIENSFQKFLEEWISNRNDTDIKEAFNTWLDTRFSSLDGLKNDEIAAKIIWPTSFELNKHAIQVELEQVQNTITFGNLKLFSSPKNPIDTQHLAQLFNLEFENKDTLLQLLQQASNKPKDENVMKFQRIIADLEQNDKDKGVKAQQSLWSTWVDWNFWINTMKALEKYIANHLVWTKLSLNNETTTLDDRDGIRTYIDQNKEEWELDLSNIQTITPEVAQELAKFNWTINLKGLKNIDIRCLTSFMNSNNTIIFPHWKLEHTNNTTNITIENDNDNVYHNIDNNICNKLINGITISEQPETEDWNILDLSHIDSMTTERAMERANHEWTINLTWLKKLNTEILRIFINSKCKRVYFPGGILTKNGTDRYIDDVKKPEINDELCKKLLEYKPWLADELNWSNWNNRNNEHAQALHEWFNYAKESNEIDEKELPKNEKDAIKLLTVWTKSSLISRALRLKWYNKNVSIVDEDYDPMRNEEERTRLQDLKAWLEACVNGEDLNRDTLINALSNWGEKDLNNLKTLYKDFKSGNFGNLPYLERVMELIDDCFVQWGMTDNEWNIIDTFTKLYTDLLIWNNYDLLAHKEKDVENLDDIKKQLNDLETDILGDENDLDDKLTREYKRMILSTANIQRLLKLDKGNFQNIYDKYSFQEKEWRPSEHLFKNLEQVKFACCLCDLNTDWKVDVADKGTKTWQELFNIILDAQIEWENAMDNILKYATEYATNCGHTNTLQKLEEMKTMDDAGKLAHIAKNPIIIQYLREMLTKTSIENTRSIILNWSVESIELLEQEQRFWEYMMDPEVDKALEEELPEIIAQIKKELQDNNELSEDQKKELEKVLNDNPENIKRTLKIGFAWYVALNQWGWFWVWWSIPVWKNETKNRVNQIAIWGHWWVYEWALLWLSLAYWNRRQNDKWTFSRNSGAIAWVNYSWGFSFLWLVSTGPEFQLNYKNLQKTLDVRSAKYGGINLIWMTNFSVLGAGGDISYRRDMLEGIEQISQDMNLKVFESLYKAYSNKWEKNFLDKQNFIELVTAQLKTDFPNTNDETLSNSANLFYLWLSYYVQRENGQEPTPAEMWKIFSNIAKDFQLNWKNTAIAALNGKIQLTWVSAWVIYIWKLVPIASITTTNYENLFAHDTQESRNSYEQNLFNESWMILHEEPWENGRIGLNTVNYLNKKLNIFFPGGNMPRIGLRYQNPGNPDPTKSYLAIPKELCKYIDISFCEELQWHIESDEDGSFHVPTNMKIWLSTYIGWWTMRANLVLWDNKKNAWDSPLTAESTFDENADPFTYQPNSESLSLSNISSINKEISKLIQSNESFPLSSCEKSNGGQLTFNMNQNISIDPSSTNMLRIYQWQLFLNNPNGELTISKDIYGKYLASFAEWDPSLHKFSIRYNTYQKFEWQFNFNNATIDALFDQIEQDLERVENGRPEYWIFMENANSVSYDQAFNNLMTMLRKKPNPAFNKLVDYLAQIENNGNNIGEFDKMLVVDRFKAIFSYNTKLNNYDNVTKIIGKRKDKFETLPWYKDVNSKFPLDGGLWVEYRRQAIENLSNNETITREPHKNLIGMTAFYRDDNIAQSFLLTELGGTNVLWDAIVKIQDNKIDATRNRLLANLEKNPTYEKALLKSIADNLKINVTDSLTDVDRHNKIIQLLQWNPVDIWWKFVTIKPNFVFYLLWECGNESVWVEIDSIEESSYADSISVEIDTSWSSAWLYVKSQAAENQMGISANSIIWWGSWSRWWPHSTPQSWWPNSTPGSWWIPGNNTPNPYWP